uniref:Secreted protein n=1 Tax=Helianthus annuus TaxID=4232 RepID=A0A251VDX8_HELAN
MAPTAGYLALLSFLSLLAASLSLLPLSLSSVRSPAHHHRTVVVVVLCYVDRRKGGRHLSHHHQITSSPAALKLLPEQRGEWGGPLPARTERYRSPIGPPAPAAKNESEGVGVNELLVCVACKIIGRERA